MAAEHTKGRVARIYDSAAADYDQVGPPFFALRGVELVRRTGVRAGHRVLDAGCGRGACLLPAAEAAGPAGGAVGIDGSAAMVREAHAEAARRGLLGKEGNVSVMTGDAEAPDFPAASFDVVLSGFVLRLLPDPAAALRAYERLLRPGGRLGLTIYAGTADPQWAPVWSALDSLMEPVPPPAVALDPADRLGALIRAAGFTGVQVTDEPFDTRFTGPGQVWDYFWASGYRGMMERIPVPRRDEARDAVHAAAGKVCEPDGTMVLRHHVRFATAIHPLP